MVPHALDHGHRAGVADAEAFPGGAAEVGLAAGGPIEGHVAGDDVVFRGKRTFGVGIEDELTAGKPLAEVVVAVALQLQGQAAGRKGSEGLPGPAAAADPIGILRQRVAETTGDLGPQEGAEGAAGAGNGEDRELLARQQAQQDRLSNSCCITRAR